MKSPWPLKPFLVIATFALGITLPQYIPQWYNWRIYEWSAAPAVLDFQPRARASEPMQEEMERLRPDTVPVKADDSKIHDPGGTMDNFYSALLRTERHQPGAVTRILHFGDSPTTADLITADVRNFLQTRFGDAGHGTYLIAKPWAWYGHRGLDVSASGWSMDPATLHAQRDGRYGVGGVSFIGGVGAESKLTLRNEGHTKLSLAYLAQPNGGEISIDAGDIHIATLDTSAPEAAELEQTWPIPVEARKFQIRVTRGSVRLFCLTFRKDAPGVMYDSIGLNGSWAGVLASHVNGPRWMEELRMARPSLVVINYGTNESGYRNYIDTTYPKDVKEILRRVKTAVPEASILIMSPMDRGAREQGGTIGTVPTLPQLVSVQARIAAENDCAFFNTFQAMGGPGTMGKWYMAEPRLVSADFIHPLPSGARIVGTLLYQALIDGYNSYKLKQLRQNLAVVPKRTAGSKP
ncbi:GDSL-type esterase/lipase family protein [uncultured Paludibaculum sp.]|uniref:GDSL-type esterase/lipase family protein n=1 Tax=uncultured Paludibaculum sp. TaxID=1765020 RepID=UPI002AABC3C4|nr:GDSL-type esterase/lipase family protein [uncultured Paludibaculum sp.]